MVTGRADKSLIFFFTAPKIVVIKLPKEGNLDIYRYDVGGGLKSWYLVIYDEND